MKKIISILIILSLINFHLLVLLTVNAQDSDAVSTASADNLLKTSSPVIENTELVNRSASISADMLPVLSPTIQLGNDPRIANPSAINRKPVKIKSFKKSNLQAKSNIVVEISDAVDNPVTYAIFYDDHKIAVDSKEETIGDQKILSIRPPPTLKPGKYRLEIYDSTGNKEVQEFIWGVLAMNTNKSIYAPNETVNIFMTVLNEKGRMVCDAKLTLTVINNESGSSEILSTDNNRIRVNPACNQHNFTLESDYQAEYVPTSPGLYKLVLSAITNNGEYTIDDQFVVKEVVPFDIERITATRINPTYHYPVTIKITANQDFSGQIIETVPSVLSIYPASTSAEIKSYDQVTSENLPDSVNQNTAFSLPFTGDYYITLNFGEKPDDAALQLGYERSGIIGHDGVDFSLPLDTVVKAIDDGKVIKAGQGDYGNTIIIEHAWGKSYYGHLGSIKVAENENIKKGNPIALSGNTGFSTGPHLHFAIEPNNSDKNNGYFGKVDPLVYLGISQAALATKNIIWQIDLKKGNSISLSYYYDAPDISPYLYLIGPVSFIENNNNIFTESRQWQIAVDAVSKIVKVVSVYNGTFSTRASSNYLVPSYSHPWLYTSGNYDGTLEIYFEAVMSITSGYTAYAELYDKTTSSSVSNSEISTNSTSPVRVRSGNIASYLSSGDEYQMRFKSSSASGTNTLYMGRLIIVQSGTITKTETVFDFGTNDIETSTSYVDDGIKQYFYYDSDQFDGSVSIYYEGFLSNATAGATAYSQLTDTDENVVSDSEISVTGTTDTRVRSSALTLTDEKTYKVKLKASSSTARLRSSRLIIVQSNFTKTESYYFIKFDMDGDISTTERNLYGYIYWDNDEWNVAQQTILYEACIRGLAGNIAYSDLNNGSSDIETLSTNSATRVLVRSTSGLTLNDNTEHDTQVRTNSLTGHHFGSFLRIRVNLNADAQTPTLEQLMRHGKWFNNGQLQPYTF